MTQKPTTTSVARLNDLLGRITHQPQVEDLWALRATLLACADEGAAEDRPNIEQSLDLVREFDFYLCSLQSKLTARHYNELASFLDMGAVGALALQDLLCEGEKSLKSYLLGGLSESMIVLASRQYIKAWDHEMQGVHHQAAWFLYDAWWRISRRAQPELPPDKRQALVDELIRPAMDKDRSPQTRMALLIRLFQTALLVLLTPLWAKYH